jgi:hypothetical protein
MFKLADENVCVRDQFNKRLLKAYKEATEVDNRPTERAVEALAS